ncbi:alpha/beta hydrolase [Mesorhizobium sp. M0119]|uniref:alpha/beta fold hydrolase n=1 Tax=Mesorhizobium sp. M0119 TaxID=2956885 RepID=UPI00333CB455
MKQHHHTASAGSLSGAATEKASAGDAYLTPRVFEVEISGGRTIRAYEVGPPDVPLVVGIHGTPNTGLGHIVNYVASGAIFCRLVTFDRQGYGGSTPQPGRKVSDIAPVVEAILTHLSVDIAAVFGSSGGGPHALAAAALLPNRISRVASLAGGGPNFGPGFDCADGQVPLMREEIVEARKGPDASRQFYRRVAASRHDPEIEKELYSLNDRRIRRLLAPLSENLAQQLALPDSPYLEEDAYVDDYQSFVSPWGFELGSIQVPVRFFHGLADLMVPPRHSEWLQSQIPNASLELFPNVGHTFSQLMPHVFAWLVANETKDQRL